MPASPPLAAADEHDLLVDALGVAPSQITALSREPLGPGSVAGFEVAADQSLTAFVDTSLLPVAVETGLVLEGQARVWIHPADPHLPALAPTAFGHAAATLLGRIGLESTASPEMVAYRPGRRAVLRVPMGESAVWVKVVRPDRVERIVDIHRALRVAGIPVPAVLGWAPDGLVVLDAAVGTPATDGGWRAGELADATDELRARLSVAEVPGTARTSLRARLPWYTSRLVELLPHRAAAVHALADDITRVPEPGGEVHTIHGDLHIGQLFLDPSSSAVTGVVDVDTAGAGHPADDAAAFLAHAIASALLTRGDAAHVWELADVARERWAGEPAVRALSAVQLIGHAVTAADGEATSRAERLLVLARTVLDGKNPLTEGFEVA